MMVSYGRCPQQGCGATLKVRHCSRSDEQDFFASIANHACSLPSARETTVDDARAMIVELSNEHYTPKTVYEKVIVRYPAVSLAKVRSVIRAVGADNVLIRTKVQ